jgi:D-tyrosyl-tRNA(Tyr) deacylase
MTTRLDGSDEDALSAHLRGDATPRMRRGSRPVAADNPTLRAEPALMGALKGALGAATDGPDGRAFRWQRLRPVRRPVERGGDVQVAAVGWGGLLVSRCQARFSSIRAQTFSTWWRRL